MVRPGAAKMVPPGFRIAFVHPDLGLGGAERLIVDAATELVKHGERAAWLPFPPSIDDRRGIFLSTISMLMLPLMRV